MTDTLDAIARERYFSDDLAQEIRRVDGDSDLGAAALADELIPFLKANITALSNQGEGLVPREVIDHLDRMCTPVDGSWLPRGTAEADARSMKIIRDYIMRTPYPAEADRRDAERLDWLALHGASMRNDDGMEGGGWFVLAPYHTGITSVDGRIRFKTVRDAIDAATQEQT